MRTLPFAAVLLASMVAWAVVFSSWPINLEDFPLFDDWSFARGASMFARGEGIHYGHWAAMPQLGQWLWAFPFIRTLGDTTPVLRISSIILSWLVLAGFYDLLTYKNQCRPAVAAFATGVLAFNPLFFMLSGTFMTDVPTLSFCLISLAFYQRAIEEGTPMMWLAASLAAAAGVSTRQNAWAVPLTALIAIIVTPSARNRLWAWAASVGPLAFGVATHVWFQGRSDVLHQRLLVQASAINFPEPHVVLILPFLVVHLLGITAWPLWALLPRVDWRRWFFWSVVLLACAGYWQHFGAMIPHGGWFPYWDGVFSPEGFMAEELVPGIRPPLLDLPARVVASVFGCLGGAALLVRLTRVRSLFRSEQLLLIFTLLESGAALSTPRLYDRYLLFLVPGLLAMSARMFNGEKAMWWAGIPALAVLAAVSTCLTHDLWAWNVARWEIGRRAIEQGIEATDIEGGFEWNGHYGPLSGRPGRAQARSAPEQTTAASSSARHYILSFSPLPGTVTVTYETYRTWLPTGSHRFYLLKLKT
jgi:hypothetical protein